MRYLYFEYHFKSGNHLNGIISNVKKEKHSYKLYNSEGWYAHRKFPVITIDEWWVDLNVIDNQNFSHKNLIVNDFIRKQSLIYQRKEKLNKIYK